MCCYISENGYLLLVGDEAFHARSCCCGRRHIELALGHATSTRSNGGKCSRGYSFTKQNVKESKCLVILSMRWNGIVGIVGGYFTLLLSTRAICVLVDLAAYVEHAACVVVCIVLCTGCGVDCGFDVEYGQLLLLIQVAVVVWMMMMVVVVEHGRWRWGFATVLRSKLICIADDCDDKR